MVEGTGLENRRALIRTVGSNPTLSATRIVTAPPLGAVLLPQLPGLQRACFHVKGAHQGLTLY